MEELSNIGHDGSFVGSIHITEILDFEQTLQSKLDRYIPEKRRTGIPRCCSAMRNAVSVLPRLSVFCSELQSIKSGR